MFDCTKARSPAAAVANVSLTPTSAALVLVELNPPIWLPRCKYCHQYLYAITELAVEGFVDDNFFHYLVWW